MRPSKSLFKLRPIFRRAKIFWLFVFITSPVAMAHEGFDLMFPMIKVSPGEPQSFSEVLFDYLILGFEHIIPKGLDHILFVLGVFFLSRKLRPLIFQISLFTVAHTLTLAMATIDLVTLPSEIVEPLIALSISLVAIENIFTSKVKPWRPFIIFVFGLLHGLGFAGVLSEIGLPDERFITALLAFNVGVEVGQLTVIVLAFLVVRSFFKYPWYRQRIVVPASLCIGLVGFYWAIERFFFS